MPFYLIKINILNRIVKQLFFIKVKNFEKL